MSIRRRPVAPLCLFTLTLLCSPSSQTQARPHVGPAATPAPAAIPDSLVRSEVADLNRIVIRFLPETGSRIREGRLLSLAGTDLSAVEAIAASVSGTLERRFPTSEAELDRLRRLAEERTRQALPDLNLFAVLVLPPEPDEAAAALRARDLLTRLGSAPGVAEAWPQSRPKSAAMQEVRVARPLLPTPDFSDMQGYLYEPPVGVWADSVWVFPGAEGQGVKMIDLEVDGWYFNHEDLVQPWYYGNGPSEGDHGTAVCGEIVGQHNGYGVNGIAAQTRFGAIFTDDIAARTLEAVGVLAPGDIILFEIQIGGPEGYMPVEWNSDTFAAIQTASALGVICCEAAANGGVNLDSPTYAGKFDRRVRDSGAILCGAGRPLTLEAESFSDYGSRVDLQGWGSSITTTGYGDLQGGDHTVQYTAGFSGTSGASPIVVGSVSSLQGQALSLFGRPLTPALAQEILSVTGSPWVGPKQVGERPNLAAARQRLLQGYGDVLVTVRDGDTQEPMSDMLVTVVESGRLHKTGAGGQVALQLMAGDLTFHVSGNFWYTEADFPFTVINGGNQEATLDVFRAPVGSLTGIVRDERLAPLDSSRITVLATPLDSAWSDPTGRYTIGQIPQASGYAAIAGMVPGRGAAAAGFDVSEGQPSVWDPILPDAETFEASNGGYAPTNDWAWGTPQFPQPPNRPIPFSGTKVWGTGLTGYYHDMTTSTLTSPVFDVSGWPHLTLSFHQWYWISDGDGGQVQVWDAAHSQWVVVQPVGDYPDDNIIILNYGPGYTGKHAAWEPAVFRLDEYAGAGFQFRFFFKTNYSGHLNGWFLDDVALDSGGHSAAGVFSASSGEGPRVIQAGPNPATAESRVLLFLPAPAEIRCELYDLAGRLVHAWTPEMLGTGLHEMLWDGRDAAGRSLGSGIYFYRLRAGSEVLRGRLARVR